MRELGWKHRISFERADRRNGATATSSSLRVAVDECGASPRHFDLRGKRVWVAGHRGMVGSAIVRRLAVRGLRVPDRDQQRARSAPAGRRRGMGRGEEARCGVRRRRAGRRHRRQRHAAGRFPVRQPPDRSQCDRHGASRRRRQAVVPVVVVLLSAACAAADDRGRAADRRRSSRPTSGTPSPRSRA